MKKRNISMRSDTNGVLHAEIKDGILSRLIDDGPALVAAILVTAASTVIGWGIYSDLTRAFYASAHEQFLVMLGVVCVIVASAGFGFGRSSGVRRARAKEAADALHANEAQRLRPTRPSSPAAAMLDPEDTAAATVAESTTVTQSKEERLRFLSNAAQELRAPLTSMCLAARIIRKHHESTPEVVERFGETLILEADKLGGTIDEFLDLTRIESGCVDWNERDLEPAELINAAISEIEPLAISYGVAVSFVLEPELNPVLADYDRVRQMITVLLGIAVREAADDVEICIQIAEANGGWIISVGDSTHVYSHSDARRIISWTDPEVDEADRATDSAAQAIGLNFCRKVASHYEGRLWVEGNLTESGCIRVTIPYPTEQALARATASAKRTQQKRGGVSEAFSDSDLESRHEAAVRALSERASHQAPEEEALDSGYAPESTTTDTVGESLDDAASSGFEAKATPQSGPLAVQGSRDLVGEASEPTDGEKDAGASNGADTPKGLPHRSEQELAAPAAPADASEHTTESSTLPSPVTAKTEAPAPVADAQPALSKLDALRDKAVSKSNATSDVNPSETGTPNSEPADKAPQTHAQPTPQAPSATPKERSAASLRHRSTTAARARIAQRADESAPEDEPTAPRPVTGMAISARRRPGARPMLALSGPAGSGSTDNGTSVRAASDKDLLELAFGDDGDNGEVSREEAELVAKATGTTVAPYNPKARTARTVRPAAPPSNRDVAQRAGDANRGREESSRSGETRNSRLNENVAKRLGIK
jgi:signal transduction histidine kinase